MVWPRGEAQAQTYMLNVQQRVELRTAKASSLIEQQFAGELANAQSADKAKTVDLSSVQLKSNVVQVDVKVVEFNKTQMKKVGLNLFSTAPTARASALAFLDAAPMAQRREFHDGRCSESFDSGLQLADAVR
jgi:pilus assembly protein CpaC